MSAKKILIIDDDRDVASALMRVLQSHGYNARHAADGEEGVRMAKEEKPDLILLDFFMPFKNGFEVYREIRANSESASVPIIALTAFGQDIGEVHGMSHSGETLDFQDRIEKPFEFNALLARMEKIISPV